MRDRDKTCFRVLKCKGEDVVRTVAYVRGRWRAESRKVALDGRLTAEQRKAGWYHWLEQMPDRYCR